MEGKALWVGFVLELNDRLGSYLPLKSPTSNQPLTTPGGKSLAQILCNPHLPPNKLIQDVCCGGWEQAGFSLDQQDQLPYRWQVKLTCGCLSKNLCSLNVPRNLLFFVSHFVSKVRGPLKNVFHYKWVIAHSSTKNLKNTRELMGNKMASVPMPRARISPLFPSSPFFYA